jgi:Uma2 family endonuclease
MGAETVRQPMSVAPAADYYPHWTVDLLYKIPHVEGERYELIQGELYVTSAPHFRHQLVCSLLATELTNWSRSASVAGVAIITPGVIYADNEAVIPDLIWLSSSRLTALAGKDGKLHGSPELVVEVLSPGKANEERDREKKLELYSRRGVLEYWIVDWPAVTVEIYRPVEGELQLAQTLRAGETLSSPLLPGFAVIIDRFITV